jgi:hypothetical protein
MQRTLCLLVFAFAMACGDGATDDQPDAGSSGSDTSFGVDTSNVAMCVDLTLKTQDALRALPRACATAEDCQIVPRSGQCECSGSFSVTADLSVFDASIAAIESNGCNHPLKCFNVANKCEYQSIFENPELIATCEANECGLAEVVSCETFVANAYGGYTATTQCTSDEQCSLRQDLNPCGCFEAVPTSYPFLAAEQIHEMIGRNRARCDLMCGACTNVSEAVCRDDGTGTMRCVAQ